MIGASTINDLHAAVKVGDITRVKKWIVERGAAVDTRKEGYTPLHKASQMGHVEVVGLLISLGADIHKKCFANYTALHFASQYGHIEIVKILLKNGADSLALLDNGKTARELADEFGFPNISVLLSEKSEKPKVEIILENVTVQTSQNTNTQSRFSDGGSGTPEMPTTTKPRNELIRSEPFENADSSAPNSTQAVKKESVNFIIDRNVLSPTYIEDQFITVKQVEDRLGSAPNIMAPIKKTS